MSKKRVASRCLVIDASIARAAGSAEAEDPIGASCHEFLMASRAVCHRIAWTDAIDEEWMRHRSGFALQWLASMQALKKVRELGDIRLADLRDQICEHAADGNVAKIVLKDCHLVEAALAADGCVASLDDRVRYHLGTLVSNIKVLAGIVWINPAVEDEAAIEWLEAGAPNVKARRLRPPER